MPSDRVNQRLRLGVIAVFESLNKLLSCERFAGAIMLLHEEFRPRPCLGPHQGVECDKTEGWVPRKTPVVPPHCVLDVILVLSRPQARLHKVGSAVREEAGECQ
ncbi:hypothetical protein H634G_11660 [Metarhizium anisopliae BRIP 53293]|uniref:Uncharacterized protein n=1 Tax=Metarhizium anisopliae BRIP 53293 TaxID=1291518 RepID=A0A0D9NH26_METAN|nr:hypothetical protein H634G_11660 [Metarhizium anisopliae BRIP 53293]